jgi:hypothetical protein
MFGHGTPPLCRRAATFSPAHRLPFSTPPGERKRQFQIPAERPTPMGLVTNRWSADARPLAKVKKTIRIVPSAPRPRQARIRSRTPIPSSSVIGSAYERGQTAGPTLQVMNAVARPSPSWDIEAIVRQEVAPDARPRRLLRRRQPVRAGSIVRNLAATRPPGPRTRRHRGALAPDGLATPRADPPDSGAGRGFEPRAPRWPAGYEVTWAG